MAASTPASTRQVRVGVAAVITDADGGMIIGRRKGSLGAGESALDGDTDTAMGSSREI